MKRTFAMILLVGLIAFGATACGQSVGSHTEPASSLSAGQSEDLARAIAFIHEHAEELQVDMSDYFLWGGSAGARMAAWLGSYGTEAFGEAAYPQPAAVIMQYTGFQK